MTIVTILHSVEATRVDLAVTKIANTLFAGMLQTDCLSKQCLEFIL